MTESVTSPHFSVNGAKTVRWGILGTASIAAKIRQAIRLTDGAELVAIASRSAERARQWAVEHAVPAAYGSYQELLDDPEIDAVYIPLPPSMHAEWTLMAAERGKHVLCEKPLCVTAQEADAMADACQRNGVQLMDGVMWVHHERSLAMRALIGEGVLGELRRMTAAFTFRWASVPEDNIRAQKELGGGSLGDLGYYCIRAVLWAFDDLPTRVYATARYRNGVDFNLSAMLWFPNDRIASFDCAFDTAFRMWFEVAGTKASIVCDDFVIPKTEDSARFWLHGGANEERKISCLVPQEVMMIQRFTDIARTGELDPRWMRDAVNTMRVCDAVAISARNQEVVVL